MHAGLHELALVCITMNQRTIEDPYTRPHDLSVPVRTSPLPRSARNAKLMLRQPRDHSKNIGLLALHFFVLFEGYFPFTVQGGCLIFGSFASPDLTRTTLFLLCLHDNNVLVLYCHGTSFFKFRCERGNRTLDRVVMSHPRYQLLSSRNMDTKIVKK